MNLVKFTCFNKCEDCPKEVYINPDRVISVSFERLPKLFGSDWEWRVVICLFKGGEWHVDGTLESVVEQLTTKEHES